MKTVFHAMLGILVSALLITGLFASLASEFWLSPELAMEVKLLVFQGMLLLPMVLALTALLGLSLSKARQELLISHKKKRTLWLFAINLLALLPISYFLKNYPQQNQFGFLYFLIQAAEYFFYCLSLVLVGLNLRDGNKLVFSGLVAPGGKI